MDEVKPKTIRIVQPIRGARFFTVPRLGSASDELQLKGHFLKTDKSQNKREGEPIMRYAGYIRVSDEDQVQGYSLDAQRRAIQEWVAARGGTLVKVYADEGESAQTTNRTHFQKMRLDARDSKFDALVVHKFDRFARNRTDSLAIKSLLRCDYKIKVFSVTEPSEDSDGPLGALIEGIMECVADWYSRNLAQEVAKGKRERGHQGLHNNQAPFGYDKDKQKLLVPNPHESLGLVMAFEAYADGKHSDADVADLLNAHGYRTKKGRTFSKDTVRMILKNQTYLGKIKYQQFRRNADRSRSYSAPIEFFEGQHEPLVSQELFDRCQAVREERVAHRQPTLKYNPYLLRNLVYCYRCCNSAPQAVPFPAFGKMRAQIQGKKHRYYRCRAKDFDRDCSQKAVHCDAIEAQVINALMQLKPPAEWQQRITETISEILGEQSLEARLQEIRGAIERMDFRWDQGFITDKTDYLDKRVKLQQELEQLTPIPEDDLERAADILQNFAKYWANCGDDPEAQHRLIKLIIERVYVQDEEVVAMTLKADYHVVLGHKTNEPTEFTIDSSVYTCGSDGIRTRGLCLDRAAC
ncbi:MAG: integrase [Chloroflexota bacterium]|nr:MAG: integrase [Chloroflexota bacterium]